MAPVNTLFHMDAQHFLPNGHHQKLTFGPKPPFQPDSH